MTEANETDCWPETETKANAPYILIAFLMTYNDSQPETKDVKTVKLKTISSKRT